MSLIEAWINKITLDGLLECTPHGFLAGCGITSEYLAYVFRVKPETWDDFREISFRGKYFDSKINEKSFNSDELEDALLEIAERLILDEYVRISFDTKEKQNTEVCDVYDGIISYIFEPPNPQLFDHSFIITSDGWRYESYLKHYSPRRVMWKNYRDDIRELFKNPNSKWEEIFNVKCSPNYDLNNVTIYVAS